MTRQLKFRAVLSQEAADGLRLVMPDHVQGNLFYQHDQYLGSFLRRANQAQFGSSGHDSYGRVELEQFTGRSSYTNDGLQEYYEGDIVQRRYGTERRVVKFVGSGFWLVGKGPDIEPTSNEMKNWEWIGTIHDTPNPLEV